MHHIGQQVTSMIFAISGRDASHLCGDVAGQKINKRQKLSFQLSSHFNMD